MSTHFYHAAIHLLCKFAHMKVAKFYWLNLSRHFLFAAGLIILSNEFAMLYKNGEYSEVISQAIDIMRYFAAADPQAHRLLSILTSFRYVVESQTYTAEAIQNSRHMQMDTSFTGLADSFRDISSALQSSLHRQTMDCSAENSGRRASGQILYKDLRIAATVSKTQNTPAVATGALSEPSQDIGAQSPGSNRSAGASRPRTENLARHGIDRNGAGSLEGDHGFSFDSFWDLKSAFSASDQGLENRASHARSTPTVRQSSMSTENSRRGSNSGHGASATGQGQSNLAWPSQWMP